MVSNLHNHRILYYLARRLLYAGCALCALGYSDAQAADVCATPDNYIYHFDNSKKQDGGRGLGGTGHTKEDDGKGIGGTGIHADNGIGGTGITGTIGVFGRITGFASICVNGQEIHYTKDMQVDVHGKNMSAADLKIGQIVNLTATISPNGNFDAQTIALYHAVVGPVETIDVAQGTMVVMGQNIVIEHISALQNIKIGTMVGVSGLPDISGKADFIASYIETVAPDSKSFVTSNPLPSLSPQITHVSIQGYTTINPKTGTLQINNMPVLSSNATIVTGNDHDIQDGAHRVLVIGDIDKNGAIQAENIIIEQYQIPTLYDVNDDLLLEKEDPLEQKYETDQESQDDKTEVENIDTDDSDRNDNNIEKPETDTPETDTPEIEEPEIEEPETDTPEIEAPEIEEPEIEEPEAG